MKRYYIRVPRDHQFYFVVEAEDSREARFEAIKHIVTKVVNDFVPIDITEGDEVYLCDGCASYFPSSDLKELDGKLVCGQCEVYANGDIPEWW